MFNQELLSDAIYFPLAKYFTFIIQKALVFPVMKREMVNQEAGDFCVRSVLGVVYTVCKHFHVFIPVCIGC